jgi:hypothetical protein
MSVYIFTGPTLSARDGRAELDAVYLPPVSQGDVYRVALKGPRAIGIVDGYFERVPAVWHKEILWAMTRGIHVYGSASMGALRAAELAPFGMEGVGEVFAMYRDGTLEDDDEVAVVHGPAEGGYRAQSEAMVNIRRTLAAAATSQVISTGAHSALERLAKELFYPDRSYALLLRRGAEQGLPATELAAFRDWLPEGRVDQKHADALAMLRTMREQLAANSAPKRVEFTFECTTFWYHATRLAGEADVDGDASGHHTDFDSVLDELRLEPDGYARVYDGATLRQLALGEAERAGLAAGAGAVLRTAIWFRRARGLLEPAELPPWLKANHLTGQRFDELMREEALVDRARQLVERNVLHALPDYLRLGGDYSRLLARARDKERLLAARGLQNPGLEDAGLTVQALLQWYFDNLRCSVPKSIAEYARSAGFADQHAFLRAVLREYCYVRLKEGLPNA